MSETFFENPIYVYIALGLAELVIAAVWYERRNRRLILAMLIPPVLAIGVAVVERLVVTDREQIMAAAGQMAEAVERRQLDRIVEHIDDEFSSGARMFSLSITKANIVAFANSRISRYSISSIKLAKVGVEVTGRTAKMHLLTMVHHGQDGRAKTPLIWDIVWIRRRDGWRMLEVTGLRQGIEF